jgi:hypothetical protein
MKFNFTFLGQCIMRYETPLDIFSMLLIQYMSKDLINFIQLINN